MNYVRAGTAGINCCCATTERSYALRYTDGLYGYDFIGRRIRTDKNHRPRTTNVRTKETYDDVSPVYRVVVFSQTTRTVHRDVQTGRCAIMA